MPRSSYKVLEVDLLSASDTGNIHKLFDVFMSRFNITNSPYNCFISYLKDPTQHIIIKEVLSQRFELD